MSGFNPFNGQVGRWSFNAVDGKHVQDESGHDYDGELINAGTYDKQDVPRVNGYGQALSIQNQADRLLLPHMINPSTTPFTATAWVKVSSLGETRPILQQENKNGVGRTWLYIRGNGKIGSWLGGKGLVGGQPIAVGEWHHTAVSYDGKILRLYLNGSLVTSKKTNMESCQGSMIVGTNKDQSRHFVGLIDELSVYDRVLTDDEIDALATQLFAGHWSFTNVEDKVTKDDSGNGVDGNVVGAQRVRIFKGGRALSFDGQDDYVAIPYILNRTQAGGFTVAVRFKTEKEDVSQPILEQQDQNGIGHTWLSITKDGKVATSLGGKDIESKKNVKFQQWTSVAISYDGELLKLYLNGRLEKNKTISLESCQGAMILGANKSLAAHFQGRIDHLSICNRALSRYEISALSGKLKSLDSLPLYSYLEQWLEKIDLGSFDLNKAIFGNINEALLDMPPLNQIFANVAVNNLCLKVETGGTLGLPGAPESTIAAVYSDDQACNDNSWQPGGQPKAVYQDKTQLVLSGEVSAFGVDLLELNLTFFLIGIEPHLVLSLTVSPENNAGEQTLGLPQILPDGLAEQPVIEQMVLTEPTFILTTKDIPYHENGLVAKKGGNYFAKLQPQDSNNDITNNILDVITFITGAKEVAVHTAFNIDLAGKIALVMESIIPLNVPLLPPMRVDEALNVDIPVSLDMTGIKFVTSIEVSTGTAKIATRLDNDFIFGVKELDGKWTYLLFTRSVEVNMTSALSATLSGTLMGSWQAQNGEAIDDWDSANATFEDDWENPFFIPGLTIQQAGTAVELSLNPETIVGGFGFALSFSLGENNEESDDFRRVMAFKIDVAKPNKFLIGSAIRNLDLQQIISLLLNPVYLDYIGSWLPATERFDLDQMDSQLDEAQKYLETVNDEAQKYVNIQFENIVMWLASENMNIGLIPFKKAGVRLEGDLKIYDKWEGYGLFHLDHKAMKLKLDAELDPIIFKSVFELRGITSGDIQPNLFAEPLSTEVQNVLERYGSDFELDEHAGNDLTRETIDSLEVDVFDAQGRVDDNSQTDLISTDDQGNILFVNDGVNNPITITSPSQTFSNDRELPGARLHANFKLLQPWDAMFFASGHVQLFHYSQDIYIKVNRNGLLFFFVFDLDNYNTHVILICGYKNGHIDLVGDVQLRTPGLSVPMQVNGFSVGTLNVPRLDVTLAVDIDIDVDLNLTNADAQMEYCIEMSTDGAYDGNKEFEINAQRFEGKQDVAARNSFDVMIEEWISFFEQEAPAIFGNLVDTAEKWVDLLGDIIQTVEVEQGAAILHDAYDVSIDEAIKLLKSGFFMANDVYQIGKYVPAAFDVTSATLAKALQPYYNIDEIAEVLNQRFDLDRDPEFVARNILADLKFAGYELEEQIVALKKLRDTFAPGNGIIGKAVNSVYGLPHGLSIDEVALTFKQIAFTNEALALELRPAFYYIEAADFCSALVDVGIDKINDVAYLMYISVFAPEEVHIFDAASMLSAQFPHLYDEEIVKALGQKECYELKDVVSYCLKLDWGKEKTKDVLKEAGHEPDNVKKIYNEKKKILNEIKKSAPKKDWWKIFKHW